jgi:hypothetical protein
MTTARTYVTHSNLMQMVMAKVMYVMELPDAVVVAAVIASQIVN